ncbi:YgaP family membrane protein [Rubrivivax sp. RP6-9]|uniref:YgaP family membrane protein n=1 Tax=Rubrivivax sp. RP6-9 TaxID=3415750 RepID=UPI003CC5A384
MKTNVGGLDRILRVVLGLVLIGLTLSGAIGVWGWIGLVPLATAAMGFCPLYTVLGFSTCPMKKS